MNELSMQRLTSPRMLRIEGGKEGNHRCAPVFMNKSNGARLMIDCKDKRH